jgi:hypothetical protein
VRDTARDARQHCAPLRPHSRTQRRARACPPLPRGVIRRASLAHHAPTPARTRTPAPAPTPTRRIDFEQLKIENQTLNEKIEERNEELLKLRKKMSTSAHVLTHFKEKLQFVAAANSTLKGALAEKEVQLVGRRDQLTSIKQARDLLRTDNTGMKSTRPLVNSEKLLLDFELRKVTARERGARARRARARRRGRRADAARAPARTHSSRPACGCVLVSRAQQKLLERKSALDSLQARHSELMVPRQPRMR